MILFKSIKKNVQPIVYKVEYGWEKIKSDFIQIVQLCFI